MTFIEWQIWLDLCHSLNCLVDHLPTIYFASEKESSKLKRNVYQLTACLLSPIYEMPPFRKVHRVSASNCVLFQVKWFLSKPCLRFVTQSLQGHRTFRSVIKYLLLADGECLLPLSLREGNQLIGIRSYQHCCLKHTSLTEWVTVTFSRYSPMISDWCCIITSCSESELWLPYILEDPGFESQKRQEFSLPKRPKWIGCSLSSYSVGSGVIIY